MLEEDFQVPFGDARDELVLSEQEANSHVARFAYREGYKEGMRLKREEVESRIKEAELSARASSTRFAADFVGVFVWIPGGALMWALGGEVAGLVTFLIAGGASLFLLTKSQRLRKQAAEIQ